jgi:hypothetical protein
MSYKAEIDFFVVLAIQRSVNLCSKLENHLDKASIPLLQSYLGHYQT